MPIPTDTYWNIKRLNVVFAVSAIVLVGVTVWSILQDYNKDWRVPQRSGRVWEAAFVAERISRETGPQIEQRIKELDEQIATRTAALESQDAEYQRITDEIRQLESDKLDLEFDHNTIKAVATEMEKSLQDAVAAADIDRAKDLRDKLAEPHDRIAKQAEQLYDINTKLAELRGLLADRTAALAELERERKQLTSDVEAQRKKLASLQPKGLLANVSAQVRAAPLMQFINPSERVRQVVLPDVYTDLGGFKRVESLDRCVTCHVNINDKNFAEPRVLEFLQEQVATARQYVLPETAGGRPADAAATLAAPGAVAMPEFWHAWGRQLAPAVVTRNRTRIGQITGVVGKGVTVTVGVGAPAEKFTFDPAVTDPAAAERQDDALVALMRTIYEYQKPADGSPFVREYGDPRDRERRVRVEIAPDADEKAIATARNVAMRYVEELANGLKAELDADAYDQLEERYRYAMVSVVNDARADEGYPPLDPSPVMLAHPDLDLYVSPDSFHPMDAEGAKVGVGCTSCHDGSGTETDFVLAAHVARPIWVDQESGVPVLPTQLRPKRDVDTHHGPDLSSMLAAVYPRDAIVPQHAGDLHLHLDDDDTHHTAVEATHNENGNGNGNGGHAAAAAGATTQPATKPAAANAHASNVPEQAPDDAPPTPYVDPVTGREGRAVSQFGYWRREFEPNAPRSFALVYHEWDRPMLPPKYLQANCVRCHTDGYDIKDHAPVVHEGRALFKNMGCVNCHQMDSIGPEAAPSSHAGDVALVMANGQRKVGTDLRHVTAKLSPAMINTWIWAPKAFRPSTKMPHFFMLENNSSDEELRRTKQEARALTEYLVRTATPLDVAHPIPQGLKGSPEGGKLVFNNVGCMACHTNLNDPTGEKRDEKDVTIGEKWIVTDLVKNGKLAEQIEAETGKVPNAAALTTEARKLYDAMSYNERQLYIADNLGERGELSDPPTYPDKSPKPVFMSHGPELSGIGTKLTAGRSEDEARQWLFDWLKDPRHYSDYTVMPRLRLADQQAIDLTEYLLSQKRTNDRPDDPWQAGLTPVDSEKLVELTSLFLRSRFSARTALAKADEDAELTALAAEALTTAHTSADEAKAQAAAMTNDERRLVFLGKKLISHYGCMSCHAINGTETMSSPCTNLSDWGQKQVSKLDFGFLDHHKVAELPEHREIPMVNGLSAEASKLVHEPGASGVAKPVTVGWPHLTHDRTSWITQKLLNTRAFDRGKVLLEPRAGPDEAGKPYDKLKMPTFYLRDDEVDAIVTFVISNRDRLVSERLHHRTLTEPARQVALGRMVAEKYNCIGCHQIEHNHPAVQQYYKSDEIVTEAPPSLRGEGNKIQHAWLFNFLKDVEPLRPLLHSDDLGGGGNRKVDIRMPSFPIEDAEATALAAYFAAASNKEANELGRQLGPVVQYIAEAMEASPDPLYAESAWPGDDWHSRPQFETATRLLVEWGLENGQLNPLQIDPTKNTPEELARSYRQLLFKARFTERLYDAPYPFVESPRPQISDDRFKRGESLFYEMQCLKCHVLGDPGVEGAQKNPTAPNLSLTQRRLQPRWVRHWVQEPPVIQTGTAMPPFLTGMALFHQGGQAWPRSQGVSGAEAERVEATYGDTPEEQAALLLDFLYAAGVRNYTGIQPAQPGPLPGIGPLPKPATQPARPAPGQQAPAAPIAQQPERSGEATVRTIMQTTPAAPAPAADAPAATQPAAATQPEPLYIHAEYGKPVLPGKAPVKAKPAAPAETAVAAGPAVAGVQVAGKVLLAGAPPAAAPIDMSGVAECAAKHADAVPDPGVVVSDTGALQDVIVWIDGVEGSAPTRTDPAVLDQQGCMYVPHVLAVQVGQPLVVKNSDAFLHNVHSLSEQNPQFNFGQPNVDPGRDVGALKVAETFRVKCDVHPWMSAYVRAFDHPFFGQSKADGTFAIANVPPGKYTVRAWHERLGTQQAEVTVEPGKPAAVELKFGGGGASASAVGSGSARVREVAAASLALAGHASAGAAKCATCDHGSGE